MATCTHAGCGCSIYLEELMGAAHMRLNGNCLNCGHPVNAHPRRPAGATAGGESAGRSSPQRRIRRVADVGPPPKATKSAVERNLTDPDFLSPCASVFLLKAHLLMFPSPAEMAAQPFTLQAAAAIPLWLTTMRDNADATRGYLAQTLDEKAITAMLVIKLTNVMATCAAYNIHYMVTHQSLVSSDRNWGYLDMGVYYEFQFQSATRHGVGEVLPFVFMEYTLGNVNDIAPQSMVYASYLFNQLTNINVVTDTPARRPFPLLGYRVGSDRFVCSMYHLTVVNDQFHVNETVVREGVVNTDFWAMMARASVDYVAFCVEVEEDRLDYDRGPKKESNIQLLGDYVYKAYDYRRSSCRRNLIARSERRSPEGYRMSALNAEVVIDHFDDNYTNGQLQILRYKYVEGSHMPTVVKHLADIVRELVYLHSENYVFGDMRLANCVFVSTQLEDAQPGATANVTTEVAMPSKIGYLIDFDYAGVTRKYPVGFNMNIPDAKRHRKAQQQLPICAEHDWFSLASIFEFFRPSDAVAWQVATDHVRNGAYQTALSILDAMADNELTMIVDPFR